MRIFLILLFILVSNTVYAKNAGGKKICEGFCRGEEYMQTGGGKEVPKNVIINGKKKKVKFLTIDHNLFVKNSWCRPFTKFIFYEPDPKKNKILDLVSISYDINICGPCPTDMKRTSSGYCALRAYKYLRIYDKAFSFGILPKNMFPNYVDYEIQDDIGDEYPTKRNLMLEIFIISITSKKDLSFWKYFSKSENKYLYMYATNEYKTSFKQQAIKHTNDYFLTNDKFIKFLNDFQERIVNSWRVDSEIDGGTIDERTSVLSEKLYNSLPTNKELDLLFYNFSEVKQFHIQTRN